jgi:uncharacterized protein DUF4287/uncharacterized protein DUF5655
MSFQAYLDTVAKQTGKTADDFHALAAERGLLDPGTTAMTVVAWLKADYGLGHGHAMAVYKSISDRDRPVASRDVQVAKHFDGRRAGWRPVYDALIARLTEFGPDVEVVPAKAYLGVVRGGKKFAIIAVTEGRLDVGLKLPGVEAPYPAAGTWNSMVTHRATIETPAQVDERLIGWLRTAYEGR